MCYGWHVGRGEEGEHDAATPAFLWNSKSSEGSQKCPQQARSRTEQVEENTSRNKKDSLNSSNPVWNAEIRPHELRSGSSKRSKRIYNPASSLRPYKRTNAAQCDCYRHARALAMCRPLTTEEQSKFELPPTPILDQNKRRICCSGKNATVNRDCGSGHSKPHISNPMCLVGTDNRTKKTKNL